MPWSSPRNVVLQLSRMAELGPFVVLTWFLIFGDRSVTRAATFTTIKRRFFVLRIAHLQPAVGARGLAVDLLCSPDPGWSRVGSGLSQTSHERSTRD